MSLVTMLKLGKVKEERHRVFKNPGYSQIIKMYGILSGEISNDNGSIEELTPEDISCFKYAPNMS